LKRYARLFIAVGWLILLPVPFLVFWWAGLIKISRAHGALVEHGALHDTTSPGVWAVLAVVYLVWIVGLTVGSIWAFDHLGYHYQPYDRPRRPTRRERRRQRAGIRYQQARQVAQRDALREIASESRRAARETDEGGGGVAGHRPPGKPAQERSAGGQGHDAGTAGGQGHDAGSAGGDERR
jgi:hypothetical protein